MITKAQRLRQSIAERQAHWDLLSEKLTRLRQQRILETRAEEQLRLEALIAETHAERQRVEQELEELEAQLAAIERGAPTSVETPVLPAALQALWDQVRAEQPPADLDLSPDTLQAIVRHEPRTLAQYRLGRIADWSQPRYALDKRFTQLTLLVDRGEDIQQGPRWESRQQFQDLRDVLKETPDTPALVLLGPPGSGKSTLLRRLEWDMAVEALRQGAEAEAIPLTFFVPLNQYQPKRPSDPLPDPTAWLAERWAQRFARLPPLEELLGTGGFILLLDALNEMPQAGQDAFALWKEFLLEMVQTQPGNRLIFSCRSLDYSSSLSSKDFTVPHVRIESLTDSQVQHFLQVYSAYGETIWRHLEDTPQLDLYRTAIYLKMLVNQADAQGRIPQGRAALFTGFVRQALQREIHAENPRFRPDDLLARRDCERLAQHRWKSVCDLPSRGMLFPKLSLLAYRMQEQRTAGEASQVRIDYDQALAVLADGRAEDILKAGLDLGVLDLDVDDVLYVHQLLQEYFAARCLALTPNPELVRVEWRADRVTPSLEHTLAQLADSDPLPPPPLTGWEETTVLAAAMAEDAEAFVTPLMEVNLPLAGRCAAQPDVCISDNLKTRIGWALVKRTQDASADLRARTEAGLRLGDLGDPRFERCQGPDGEYLLPPLVDIPGGTYTLGSDEGHYQDETPVHTVELAPFRIGKFPVTHAEWALFMKAGGYEDERWWVTEADKAWRRGEGTSEGPKQQWREDRKWLQDNFDRLHEYPFTSKQIEDYREYARMDDDEFERLLEGWYPPGRQTEPDFWNDSAFNNLAQPVVGICWFEARAYCAWLSAQMGLAFRLPTEAQWEAVARGQAGRRYAYGNDFDVTRGNSFEAHIRRTTPIGIFPGGETPEGVVDMTGNTWDWTSSLYRPYPYVAADGREDPASGAGRRVVRGGSWGDVRFDARAASRARFVPGLRHHYVGLRVACPSPI